jgi:hypothetical protein
MLAELTLGLALSQLATEPTVPVILTPDQPIVTMTVAEAERRLASETDPKWIAALVWALGTRLDNTPTHKPLIEMTATERGEHEFRRWTRRAAQAQR